MATAPVPGSGDQADDEPAVPETPGDDTGTSGTETGEPAAEGSGEGDTASEGDDQEDGPDLLSEEDRKAAGSDPKKLEKALRRAFTQKTQKLSTAARLSEALEQDPVGVITALAQRAGLQIAQRETPKQVDLRAQIRGELSELIGSEEVADKLLPIIEKVSSAVAQQHIQGVRRDVDATLASQAKEQSDLVMERFTEKRPDWKKHEKAMMDIASRIRPEGMDPIAYLDSLYKLATHKDDVGATTRRAVDKLVESANAGERPGGAPSNRVAPPVPNNGKLTIRQALEMAARGQRVED